MENKEHLIQICFYAEFHLYDIVYLITDKEQLPRMITGYFYGGTRNEVMYELTCGAYIMDKWFSASEISYNRDVILSSTN